ncbi:MAG: hypothetical protein NT045_04950 [Candidatus Aureabacteria bacterium]|nr:hypothetical protein [Candidatus Auribacterota bacterium]
MSRIAVAVCCAVCMALLATGCKIPTLKSTDVMYGPSGEIVKMKSPDRTMKIKVKGDEVTVKGARGIGGQSRMAPLPVESGRDVGMHGVMVPPPVGPGPGMSEQGISVQQQTTTEETTVVH